MSAYFLKHHLRKNKVKRHKNETDKCAIKNLVLFDIEFTIKNLNKTNFT